MRMVSALPRDLPATVLVVVVVHIPDHAPSVLPQIQSRSGSLPAWHPQDGEPLEHGRIYCAPKGAHMLVERGRIPLAAGPCVNRSFVNRSRPAIDPLFRTAAVAYGTRVIGVVLTGALNDGTAGLLAIKRRGGLAVAQDPEEALMPSMPSNALAYVDVDKRLLLAQIPAYLVAMAHAPAPLESDAPAPTDMHMESEMSGLRPGHSTRDAKIGNLSIYTCPECKGPLWEIQDANLLWFRCQIGHAYTSDALLYGQAQAVDDAHWAALETLEQRADVAGRLAERAREQSHPGAAARFDAQVREMRQKIETLRQALPGGAMHEMLSIGQEEPFLGSADNDVFDGANAADAATAEGSTRATSAETSERVD